MTAWYDRLNNRVKRGARPFYRQIPNWMGEKWSDLDISCISVGQEGTRLVVSLQTTPGSFCLISETAQPCKKEGYAEVVGIPLSIINVYICLLIFNILVCLNNLFTESPYYAFILLSQGARGPQKSLSSTPSTQKVWLQILLGGTLKGISRHDVQLNCGIDFFLGKVKGQDTIGQPGKCTYSAFSP